MKFKHEPGGEVSGTYPDGSVWHIRASEDGLIVPKDEHIDRVLADLAALPDHPIRSTKG